MRTTTITFPSGRTAVRLEPEDGYKYITNGDVWSNQVTLAEGAPVDAWHDTNDEPPEPAPEEEATAEDYEEALGRFGV